tara:strand:- start:659 stop:1018 length:360 start_codon:yes stop_codon:yes gene_type:complete
MRELKITRKKDTDKKEEKIPKSYGLKDAMLKRDKSKSVDRELDPIKRKESTIPKSYGALKALISRESFKDLPEDKQAQYKRQMAILDRKLDPITEPKPKTLQEKNAGIKSFLDKRYNKK